MNTILVVEDDPGLLKLMTRLLQKSNYNVVDFSTGEEAIEYLNTDAEILMALLDINLPGISGEMLVSEVRKLRPDMHIIIVSGMCQEQEVRTILQMEKVNYLQKPFSNEKLLETVKFYEEFSSI